MNRSSFSFSSNQLFSGLFLSGGNQNINDDQRFSEEVNQEQPTRRFRISPADF
jgi:hypothetical protein